MDFLATEKMTSNLCIDKQLVERYLNLRYPGGHKDTFMRVGKQIAAFVNHYSNLKIEAPKPIHLKNKEANLQMPTGHLKTLITNCQANMTKLRTKLGDDQKRR